MRNTRKSLRKEEKKRRKDTVNYRNQPVWDKYLFQGDNTLLEYN